MEDGGHAKCVRLSGGTEGTKGCACACMCVAEDALGILPVDESLYSTKYCSLIIDVCAVA